MLQKQVCAHDIRIRQIEKNITTNTDSINDINNGINDINNNIATNTTAISNINTKHTNDINTINSSINNINTKHTNDINRIDSEINTIHTITNNISEDITTNTNEINTLKQDVANNTSNINTNTINIAQNNTNRKADINNLESKINIINSKISPQNNISILQTIYGSIAYASPNGTLSDNIYFNNGKLCSKQGDETEISNCAIDIIETTKNVYAIVTNKNIDRYYGLTINAYDKIKGTRTFVNTINSDTFRYIGYVNLNDSLNIIYYDKNNQNICYKIYDSSINISEKSISLSFGDNINSNERQQILTKLSNYKIKKLIRFKEKLQNMNYYAMIIDNDIVNKYKYYVILTFNEGVITQCEINKIIVNDIIFAERTFTLLDVVFLNYHDDYTLMYMIVYKDNNNLIVKKVFMSISSKLNPELDKFFFINFDLSNYVDNPLLSCAYNEIWLIHKELKQWKFYTVNFDNKNNSDQINIDNPSFIIKLSMSDYAKYFTAKTLLCNNILYNANDNHVVMINNEKSVYVFNLSKYNFNIYYDVIYGFPDSPKSNYVIMYDESGMLQIKRIVFNCNVNK